MEWKGKEAIRKREVVLMVTEGSMMTLLPNYTMVAAVISSAMLISSSMRQVMIVPAWLSRGHWPTIAEIIAWEEICKSLILPKCHLLLLHSFAPCLVQLVALFNLSKMFEKLIFMISCAIKK